MDGGSALAINLTAVPLGKVIEPEAGPDFPSFDFEQNNPKPEDAWDKDLGNNNGGNDGNNSRSNGGGNGSKEDNGSDGEPGKRGKKFQNGAIVGIVVGSVAVAGVECFLLWLASEAERRQSEREASPAGQGRCKRGSY